MTSEATPSVFLDADVLAAPVTRSLILIAAQQDDPRTPQALHAVLASEHPRLFDAMRNVFSSVESAHAGNRKVSEPFRGVMCIACGVRTHEAIEDTDGLCRACGQ
jgi:hypothetical protein